MPTAKVVACHDARGLELGPVRENVVADVAVVVRRIDERQVERAVRDVGGRLHAVAAQGHEDVGPRARHLANLAGASAARAAPITAPRVDHVVSLKAPRAVVPTLCGVTRTLECAVEPRHDIRYTQPGADADLD